MCPRLQPLTRCNLDSASAARNAVPAVPPRRGGAAEPRKPRTPAVPGRPVCLSPPAPPRPPPTPRTLTFVLCQLAGRAGQRPSDAAGGASPRPWAAWTHAPRWPRTPGPCVLASGPRPQAKVSGSGVPTPRRPESWRGRGSGRAGPLRVEWGSGPRSSGGWAAGTGVACPAAVACAQSGQLSTQDPATFPATPLAAWGLEPLRPSCSSFPAHLSRSCLHHPARKHCYFAAPDLVPFEYIIYFLWLKGIKSEWFALIFLFKHESLYCF